MCEKDLKKNSKISSLSTAKISISNFTNSQIWIKAEEKALYANYQRFHLTI